MLPIGQSENLSYLQRLLWEHIRDAVVITDDNFVITAWNAGAERLYGWTAAEAQGRSGLELLSTEYPGVDKATMLAHIQELGHFRGDALQLRKDGTRIHVEVDAIVLRDESRKILGYLSVNHDISIRKHAEEQIVERERFVRTIADGVPGLIAYWDKDLRCRFANAAYQEWFGRAPEEMRGIHLGDLLGEELFRKNEPYVRGALRGEHQAFGRTLVRPSGEVGHTWAQYVPDATDEGVNGFFVLVADITAQKKIETDLEKALAVQRALAAHAAHAIISTDTTGVVVSWNPAAEALTDLSTQEVVGKLKFTDVLDPAEIAAQGAEVCAELGEVMTPGFETLVVKARLGLPTEHEWTFIRRDGVRVPVLLGITAIRDSRDRITGYLALAAGLSARKQMETELRRAKEAAEQANAAKSEFLATMSHEIRTPLNGVLGMTQLLRATALDASQREMVDLMRRSGDVLLSLINDILDDSKIEAGKLDVETTTFSVREIIDEVVDILRPHAQDKGLALRWVPGREPGWVKADRNRTRQVLLNLVGNSIKFTAAGAVTVTMKPEASGLVIAVADTGIGIPEAKQDRIFKRFTQADASTTRKFGGTGLGLAISARLVELMGGTISFESREGVGSTFRVALPRSLEDQSLPKAPVRRRLTPFFAGVPPLNGMRVLLAEDAPVNQRVATALLTKLGCIVDVANNGREALRLFQELRHEIILMDCQMPEMDGFEATRAIRLWETTLLSGNPGRRPTFIVALTAGAMTDERERCYAAGMDLFLAKPFDLEELSTLLTVEAERRGAA